MGPYFFIYDIGFSLVQSILYKKNIQSDSRKVFLTIKIMMLVVFMGSGWKLCSIILYRSARLTYGDIIADEWDVLLVIFLPSEIYKKINPAKQGLDS